MNLQPIGGVSLCALLIVTAACGTASYSDPSILWGSEEYRGELTEAQVLDPGRLAPGWAGTAPLAPPTLHAGDRVMLIQSGARVPDPELVGALGGPLEVTTFSGLPPVDGEMTTPIRQAAAQAGIGRVLCVWGRLRSEDRATRGTWVSWVPVLGWNLDDAELTTEVQLRFVLVDVPSGAWSEFLSEPLRDVVTHAPIDRDLRDEPGGVAVEQALRLKRAIIEAAVPRFLARYGITGE